MTVRESAVGHGIHEAGHAIRHAVDSLHREGLAIVRIASKRHLALPAVVLLGFLAGNSPGVISPAEAQAANRLSPSGTVEPVKGSPTLGISVSGLPDSPLPPASSGEPPPRPDTGVPSVLPDQPSQPLTEGPVEGGAEGGNGTSGGGAVEPPASEPTPETQVARSPVVRRTEVSRELVEEYPEQSDGTTVYVKKYKVTFSDGQTEDRYEIVLPAGAPPPSSAPKVVDKPQAVEGPPPNEGFRPFFANQPGDASFLESARASCGDKIEQATKAMLGYKIPKATAAVETLREFNPRNFRLSNFESAGWNVTDEISKKHPNSDLPFNITAGISAKGEIVYKVECDPNILARYSSDRDYLQRALVFAARMLEKWRLVALSQGVEGFRKTLGDPNALKKIYDEVKQEVWEDRPLWDALVRAGAKTK